MASEENLPIGILGRRDGFRISFDELIFVVIPEGNPAFVVNLGEGGMAIQAMEVLEPGQSLDFLLPLPEGELEVKGKAVIVWSDHGGRAGLKFAEISEADLFQLRQWVREKAS